MIKIVSLDFAFNQSVNRALKCDDVEEEKKNKKKSRRFSSIEEKATAFAGHATPPLLFPAKSLRSLNLLPSLTLMKRRHFRNQASQNWQINSIPLPLLSLTPYPNTRFLSPHPLIHLYVPKTILK